MTNSDSSSTSLQYHLAIRPGDVAQNILLVGDPARAERVAKQFDGQSFRKFSHREFKTFTGTHQGLPLSVVAVGISSANMEIAVIELLACIDNPVMIRCGSSGALQADIGIGDLIVTQAAYRLESTSLKFVGEGYPAFSHHEVIVALIEAAELHNANYHVGITATADGFYGAQGRHCPGFPPRHPDVISDLKRQGIKNLEMETSCLLTLASLRGFRAGAICAAFATRSNDEFLDEQGRGEAEEKALQVALSAFHQIAIMDSNRGSTK